MSEGERIPSEIVFDEEGFFAEERGPLEAESASTDAGSAKAGKGRCALGKLEGSWFLQLLPKKGAIQDAIRGVMRLEVGPGLLRISGDVYVRSGLSDAEAKALPAVITPDPLVIGRNWYPSFPQSEYRWYFRSTDASYKKKLFFRFARHLWDADGRYRSCARSSTRPVTSSISSTPSTTSTRFRSGRR